MTETIQRKINDSAFARWTALVLIASTMFFGYMFVDVLSPLKNLLETSRGWNSTVFGLYGGSEFILNVCGFLIVAGIILAVGRIVGETAALIYTASSVAKIPDSVFSSTRTLAVHMYLLSSEGLHIDKTYATAVVLLVIVIGINALSSFVAKKITKKQG